MMLMPRHFCGAGWQTCGRLANRPAPRRTPVSAASMLLCGAARAKNGAEATGTAKGARNLHDDASHPMAHSRMITSQCQRQQSSGSRKQSRLPRVIKKSRQHGRQFSEGLSTRSMTSISTGPLADSSLRPSCSCSATKMEGPSASVEADSAEPPGGAATGLGVHSRPKLNSPVRPVLSMTVRSRMEESCQERVPRGVTPAIAPTGVPCPLSVWLLLRIFPQ